MSMLSQLDVNYYKSVPFRRVMLQALYSKNQWNLLVCPLSEELRQ
jgi:hypothetical protein